ncbi:hypothetical protein BDZ97DRAFT_1758592 [Flammula alnicola]|nr:hypothetical protein BDZ97DRAFT_1764049 [Flammula alnicola]KAF8963519.1 hypothetical protein BDZ97DRAFT_1758592 [Flammula alnicola]
MSRPRPNVVSSNTPSIWTAAGAGSRNASPVGFSGPSDSLRSSSPGSDFSIRRSDSPLSSASATFIMPSIVNPEKLYQAYLDSQSKISNLESEVEALKAQLADAQLKSTGKGTRKKGVISADQDPASPVTEEIRKLGRHFQIFFTPYVVDSSAFVRPCPDFSSDDPARYANPANQALGITAELYESIPAKFHKVMRLTNFLKNFREAMGSSRSSSLGMLRQQAANIFGLSPEYFAESDKAPPPQRDTIPEIQSLLGSGVNGTGPASKVLTYPPFPPILCLGGDTEKIENRFLNEHLFMIARAAIFGKSAAKKISRAVARSSSTYLRPDVPAQTTFGFIAWVAIMARYILSKDEQFDNGGIGPQTQITYSVDFDYYKHYLTQAQHRPASAAWVEKLLFRWDEEIFSTHNKSKGNFPASDAAEVIELDDAAEIERELDMLHLTAAHEVDQTDNEDFYVPGPWTRTAPVTVEPHDQPHSQAVIVVPASVNPPATHQDSTETTDNAIVSIAIVNPAPAFQPIRRGRSAINPQTAGDSTPGDPVVPVATEKNRGRGRGRGRGTKRGGAGK